MMKAIPQRKSVPSKPPRHVVWCVRWAARAASNVVLMDIAAMLSLGSGPCRCLGRRLEFSGLVRAEVNDGGWSVPWRF
jgi:hypothetical protein